MLTGVLGPRTQGVCKYKPWQFLNPGKGIPSGMQKIAALIAVLIAASQLALIGAPAMAQPIQSDEQTQASGTALGSVRSIVTERWVEEWDPEQGRWVRIEQSVSAPASDALPTVTTAYSRAEPHLQNRAAARYSRPAIQRGGTSMLAQYGPFMVTSATSAAMIGPTDSSSPRHFDAMLRDFPHLDRLDMVEAPGTSNDIANLAVGRQIRAAGIATHVPRGGSVRSGAVELFLAGTERTIDDGAEFAVHSWLDNHGREADDFAANDPAHRLYIDYYVEMGMSERRARDFYAMTNSVPHARALWLMADDMRYWLRPEERRDPHAADLHVVKHVSPHKDRHHFAGKMTAAAQLSIAYSDLSKVMLAQLAKNTIAIARSDVVQLDSRLAFP